MSAFSTLELYRDLDPRRHRSSEWDYGVQWGHRGARFRVSWVEQTGELIAVRLGPGPRPARQIKIATHLNGRAMFDQESLQVYVLAKIPDRQQVDHLLDGWWEQEIDEPESLGWILDRAEAFEAVAPAPTPQRRRRPRQQATTSPEKPAAPSG